MMRWKPFFYQSFLSRTVTILRTAGKGNVPHLVLATTTTRSQTFRPLFTTLHLKYYLVFLIAAQVNASLLLEEIFTPL